MSVWCKLPWTHLQILPGGQMRPCCRFLADELPPEVSGQTPQEFFESPFMRNLRARMLAGETIRGCAKCYEEEAAGKRLSNRQLYNARPEATGLVDVSRPRLQFLELAFSNLCNSKCVMCGPRFSHRWAEDQAAVLGVLPSGPALRTMDPAVFDEHLDHITHLKFTGGEPFLIPQFRVLLERLVARERAQEIYLNYSTNLTIPPPPELVKLWQKFRFVEVACSLDAVGRLAEFIRYPARWSQIEKVVKHLFRLGHHIDLRCGLRTSVMIYNVAHLPEVLDWWINVVNAHDRAPFSERSWVNPTHVQVPEFLAINALPPDAKVEIAERLSRYRSTQKVETALAHLVNFMWSEDRAPELWPQFQAYTRRLEAHRHLTWEDARADHPPIKSLITRSVTRASATAKDL